jgi:hypothetical protein
LTSEKYPSGKIFNYSVDDFGRLQTVADSQRTYLSSVSFTNQGLLNQMSLGDGTSETFAYDNCFQMTTGTWAASLHGRGSVRRVIKFNLGVFKRRQIADSNLQTRVSAFQSQAGSPRFSRKYVLQRGE